MNNFFYDLNKRLSQLAAKQDAKQITEDAKASAPKSKLVESMEVAEAGYSAKAGRAGKDLGKPGKNFSKIAKGAAERYGSKAAGERVAGAVLNKLRHPTNEGTCPTCDCSPCKCDTMEESALQAYLGNKKYGKQGMDALRKAGREHAGKEKMAKIRAQYDKMDEADMEEGNAFTGALAKTPKGGKFKVGGKEFTDTSSLEEADNLGLEEGFEEMDAWLKSREKEKGTGKFDKKERTLPGGMKATTYTRKHDDEEDDDKDAPEGNGGAPKKKGRPTGPAKGPERVTAKSYKYKAGRPAKTNENGIPVTDRGEYDDEAGMAKDQLHTIVRHARELERALRDNENLPEWVQEKMGQIKGMMTSVTDYILSTHERDAEQHTGREGITLVPEKAVSKAQRKFMGMAHAIQKGEKIKGASPELKKVAKTMKPSDTHDFAVTKEKGLPKKVKKTEEGAKPDFLDVDKDGDKKETFKKAVKDKAEKKVDETTVSGSVATATPSGKSSKGGMQFGKGVYESLDNKLENMIAESIHVKENVEECGMEGDQPSITITADGEEVAKLMMLLKLAGLEGCPTCGRAPCGCEELDENSPDWPTNTEKLDAEPNLRTYSGGLNGPKSTGQTTTPVIASQLRRQASMEESVELERTLFKTWKNYKG
jgi:hypothetical protein